MMGTSVEQRMAIRGCTGTRPRWRVSDLWRAPLTDLPIRDEILYQFAEFSTEMNLLEIGPGSGFPTIQLARLVRHLTTVDVAEPNIARLRPVFASVANIRLLAGDISDPRVVDDIGMRFDAIEAVEVFEYVPNPRVALQNMAALLYPGGQLYLQYPNVPGAGVTFFQSRDELFSALSDAGFVDIRIDFLRLRPWASLLYRYLHEKPLHVFRRARQRNRPAQAHTYEATWAFREGSTFDKFKPPIHLAWTVLLFLMRLGGDCFERLPAGDIFRKNLLVVATRAIEGGVPCSNLKTTSAV